MMNPDQVKKVVLYQDQVLYMKDKVHLKHKKKLYNNHMIFINVDKMVNQKIEKSQLVNLQFANLMALFLVPKSYRYYPMCQIESFLENPLQTTEKADRKLSQFVKLFNSIFQVQKCSRNLRIEDLRVALFHPSIILVLVIVEDVFVYVVNVELLIVVLV